MPNGKLIFWIVGLSALTSVGLAKLEASRKAR